jgi:hypothetical protein
MTDTIMYERAARYRENMRASGARMVRLWVPTENDADTLKSMAKQMRERERGRLRLKREKED